MSEAFIKAIFEGDNIHVPCQIRGSLKERYPCAMNTEWLLLEDCYEAIFFDGQAEKIAKFSLEGKWLETGVNLLPEAVPAPVTKTALTYGEIMSTIEFYSPGYIRYEIIVRDNNMSRHILLFDNRGELLEEQRL